MPDYNTTNSIIYKISCKNPEILFTYIGSTICFKIRKANHKRNSYDETKTITLYKTIRENGGWDNWEINPIEIFPCECKTALNIREQYWIGQEAKPLNERTAHLTEQEKKEYNKSFYKANEEVLKEKRKIYDEVNKEKIAERTNAYREANKEKQKAQTKAYREANKELLAEKYSVWFEANKDKRNATRRETWAKNKKTSCGD